MRLGARVEHRIRPEVRAVFLSGQHLIAEVCAGLRRGRRTAAGRDAGGERDATTLVRERRRAGQTATLAGPLAGDFIEGNLSNIWLVLNNTRAAANLPSLGQPPDSDALDARRRWRFVLQGLVLELPQADNRRAHVYRELHAVGGARPDRRRAKYVDVALLGVRAGHRLRSGALRSPSRIQLDLRLRSALRTGSSGLKKGLLGDWYVAGVVTASSGVPLDVCQRAGVYGGGLKFVTCTGALLNGGRSRYGVFGGVAGSGGVGTSGNPAAGGTG